MFLCLIPHSYPILSLEMYKQGVRSSRLLHVSKILLEQIKLTAKSSSSQTSGRRPRRMLVAIGNSPFDLVLRSYSWI